MLLPMLSGGQPLISPLTIGDTVPDIAITNVYNYPASTIQLSDLKGKLVILDFMSTGCVPCIKVLPKLDSLQMKYGGQVQIILLSTENPGRIQSFLKTHSYLHLPFVAADTILPKLFPHEYISHIVWMDDRGIVKGITHSEYINANNIDALLQRQQVNWPVKRDVTSYDFKQPLLTINESNIPEFSFPASAFYTSVVSYMPGVQKHNQIAVDPIKNTTHVSLINYSIIDLYLLLYQRYNFPVSHVLLQVKNSERLVYNPAKGYYDDWQEKNFYCIDAMLPANVPWLSQQDKLIGDCNFYLGLQGKMENRSVDCLVLRNKKNTIINATGKGKDGLRVGMIIYLMNNKAGVMPVIDETSGTTYTMIPVTEKEVANNAYFRKILDRYGLEFITEKREIEFLVITQQP